MSSETSAIWSPLASSLASSRSRSRSSRFWEACWGWVSGIWVAWIASRDESSFTSSKSDDSRCVDSSKTRCRRWEISDRTRLDESHDRSFILTMMNFWTRSMSFEAVVAIEAVTTMREDVIDTSIISFSFIVWFFSFWIAQDQRSLSRWHDRNRVRLSWSRLSWTSWSASSWRRSLENQRVHWLTW